IPEWSPRPSMLRSHPRTTLVPYTTLFRSPERAGRGEGRGSGRGGGGVVAVADGDRGLASVLCVDGGDVGGVEAVGAVGVNGPGGAEGAEGGEGGGVVVRHGPSVSPCLQCRQLDLVPIFCANSHDPRRTRHD